jgi:hypothetical protein
MLGEHDRIILKEQRAGLEPPLIEKLITLTLSMMACSTAAESLSKQPWRAHTLYMAIRALGAMPEILAATLALPPAVLDVWVPYPSSSRRVELTGNQADNRIISCHNACFTDQLVVAGELRVAPTHTLH